ncbi:geranylgeranyl diphosphate synthase, type I [Thermomonospora echinospora]|uniref:Geranylgeranyl diphosphate synthase, type I n=1 Tax=Thermomonospora echinospora TaxID=1992 RepID=A0A1H5ZYR8_9ACTN|nr:polyprenyl synthetase family protein [Thermomonospora echinospora]SEG40935.1 geranylgeranyl diphosphate synthase, type I [Thermomonospora echinospora]
MTTVPISMLDVRAQIDGAMRAAVGRLDPRTHRVAAYHLGWADAAGRPADAGGKSLRPALALLSARAAGADPEVGVPGAVAVELTHAFSLLHDDIMDGDRTRRHRPAAWTVFGEPAAILTGDALAALAGELLLEVPGPGGPRAARSLAAATRRLIAGQALDLGFEERDQVGLRECLTMSADKTASLLACSCSIGAVLAGAPEPLVAGLAAFGAELGLAFQLVDDLLGVWGEPAVTGKPALSDLRSRKKTLPVVAALTAGTAESARLAELYARPSPLSDAELREAARLVEAAGGRGWAEAEAGRRVERAAAHLADADLPDLVRTEFLDIAAFVTRRDH